MLDVSVFKHSLSLQYKVRQPNRLRFEQYLKLLEIKNLDYIAKQKLDLGRNNRRLG